MRQAHALGIDRGSKYIWLAYSPLEWSDIIFPIGYIMNDSMTYYYIADLIGLEVYTDQNEYLGKVDDIFNTKSNDVYVIKDDLGKNKLLPGIPEVIKEISLEDGKIIVHLIEGL